MIIRRLAILVLSAALGACATMPPGKDYAAFYAAKPRSILVVPVINHSAETEAADLFLTTLAIPLAERGYYAFPTNLSKSLIEDDGLSDPYLVHSSKTSQIAGLFGADAVLYVEILDWRSKYAIASSNIVVKFLYTIKDGRTDQLLWQDEQEYVHSTSANSGNIFADIIANAITSVLDGARSDYTPVAIAANAAALSIEGQGLPYGPYSPLKEENSKKFPSTGSGRLSNADTVAVSNPAK